MNSVKRFQRSALSVTAAAIAFLSLLSACGSDENTEPASAASQVTASTTATPTTSAAPPTVAKTQGWLRIFDGTAPAGAPNAVQLTVASNPAVGQYVSDGAGRSLYRFDKDTAKPSVSNCSGPCATTWPPLTVARDQSIFASGVDPQLVGFIERADGSCQITIGGWPVYYFSKDRNPGDLLGQGVGGTWFAVAPNGAKAQAQ